MEQSKTPASSTKHKKIIGAVRNGIYTSGNIDHQSMQPREHALHRQYVRDRMREDYGRDIVQPFKNGQINDEFIEAYGKNDEFVKDLVNET